MINDRQRERLEALLRLAEDPGTSQEERDLALERFTVLATKYQIDAAQLNQHSGQYTREDIVSHTFTVPESYGLSRTRHHGLYSVAIAMGADCYLAKEYQQHGKRVQLEEVGLTVYAPESTMQALKVLIPSLVLQEVNASAAYIRKAKETDPYLAYHRTAAQAARALKKSPKEYQNALNQAIRVRRKSFCLAFFVEAAKLIGDRRKDAVQRVGDGYALVLVDTADRIQAAMEDLDLSYRKTRKDAQYNADGWNNGTAAGRQAMVGQAEISGGRLELAG